MFVTFCLVPVAVVDGAREVRTQFTTIEFDEATDLQTGTTTYYSPWGQSTPEGDIGIGFICVSVHPESDLRDGL